MEVRAKSLDTIFRYCAHKVLLIFRSSKVKNSWSKCQWLWYEAVSRSHCGTHEVTLTFDIWPPKCSQFILESFCGKFEGNPSRCSWDKKNNSKEWPRRTNEQPENNMLARKQWPMTHRPAVHGRNNHWSLIGNYITGSNHFSDKQYLHSYFLLLFTLLLE